VWWPLLVQAIRDIVCLAVGVWLLLFTRGDSTRAIIGALLLTLSAAGAAKAVLGAFGRSGGEK